MKNLFYITILFVLIQSNLNAQVVIGGGVNSTPHPNSILTLENTGNSSSSSKGFILPSVERWEDLPLYDASQTDFFQDDSSYEGMMMYVKEIDESRAMYYDGEKWVDAFTDRYTLKSRVSFDPSTPEANLPKTVCVLIACDEVFVPLNIFTADDKDELHLVNPSTEGFRISNTGLYRVQTSFSFRSSGLHVTPPQISIQTYKNDEIVGQAIANMNTLLISGNAPMTATSTFIIWAEKNDILRFSVGGAIPILTVADTYTVQPNDNTYAIVERIF
jgi:hypothetical protein